jgi:phosphodiesterase/alkaline phosphatase D-like protein
VEVALKAGFAAADLVLTDTVDVDIMSECSARVTLAGLAPGTQHYYRVCLHKSSHGFAGLAGGCFAAGSFCTLPGSCSSSSSNTKTGIVSAQDVSFVTMAAGSVARRPAEESTEQWAATAATLSPSFCLMMGDLAAAAATSSAATITREERVRRYSRYC